MDLSRRHLEVEVEVEVENVEGGILHPRYTVLPLEYLVC
jgi:hypothetical protein